jgi:hypothetical protein
MGLKPAGDGETNVVMLGPGTCHERTVRRYGDFQGHRQYGMMWNRRDRRR